MAAVRLLQAIVTRSRFQKLINSSPKSRSIYNYVTIRNGGEFRCNVVKCLFPVFRRTVKNTALEALRLMTGFKLAFACTAATGVAYCLENRYNYERLFRAVKSDDVADIQRCLKLGLDVNKRHVLGWSLLHVAAINNCENAIRALLDAGADPDIRDDFSTVHQVAHQKQLNSLQVLLVREDEFSDRLNARSSFKWCTALHYAVLAENENIIKLLLNAGADPTIENETGHRPAAYARTTRAKSLLEEDEKKFAERTKEKEREQRQLFPLEQRLKENIIGQDGAITTVASASDKIAQHALQLRQEALEVAQKRSKGQLGELEIGEDITISKCFKEDVIRPILKRHFRRDEFLGRINEIVYFLPFSRSELSKLVVRELDFWAKKAKDKHGISLSWDHQVIDALADGYNVHYGARSVKHEVERRVVGQLALAHERNLISKGCTLKLAVRSSQDDLTKGTSKDEHQTPTIIIKMVKDGTKNKYIDIDLKKENNRV